MPHLCKLFFFVICALSLDSDKWHNFAKCSLMVSTRHIACHCIVSIGLLEGDINKSTPAYLYSFPSSKLVKEIQLLNEVKRD